MQNYTLKNTVTKYEVSAGPTFLETYSKIHIQIILKISKNNPFLPIIIVKFSENMSLLRYQGDTAAEVVCSRHSNIIGCSRLGHII